MRRRKLHAGRGLGARMAPRDLARFLAFVRVDEHGCWVWTGHVDANGYGQFKWGGKARWAHRLAYANFRGRIRNGNEIDHRYCPRRNAACVNPAHLSQTDHLTNSTEDSRHRAAVAASVEEEPPF